MGPARTYQIACHDMENSVGDIATGREYLQPFHNRHGKVHAEWMVPVLGQAGTVYLFLAVTLKHTTCYVHSASC